MDLCFNFSQSQKGSSIITLMKDPYILIAAGQTSKHKLTVHSYCFIKKYFFYKNGFRIVFSNTCKERNQCFSQLCVALVYYNVLVL